MKPVAVPPSSAAGATETMSCTSSAAYELKLHMGTCAATVSTRMIRRTCTQIQPTYAHAHAHERARTHTHTYATAREAPCTHLHSNASFVKFERRTTLFIPVVLLRVVLEHPDAPAECSIVRDARHWRESARTQVRALVRVLVSSAVRQRQGTQRGWTSQSCGAQAGAQDTMITQVLTALAPVRAGGAAQE